jgi:hypothetical protein
MGVVLRKRKRVIYQSGDIASTSGIYEVQHTKICLPERVIVLEGQAFPNCPRCGAKVSFRLKTAAPHIRSDEDFSESQ